MSASYWGSWFAGGAILACLAAGCSVREGDDHTGVTPKKVADPPARVAVDDLPAGPVPRPAPPPEGYVGSAACAACHEEICRTFSEHPMGRSAAWTPSPGEKEDYSAAKAEFTRDQTRYRVEKKDGQVVHHELGLDSFGEVMYDQSAPIGFAIGSGTRGRSYCINRDGLMYMSPISWFSRNGGYWDLSPGYESRTQRVFERRALERCLICHVGRMEPHLSQADRWVAPYFHELAIGCERCHGPGQEHVRCQESATPPKPDDSIVNPAKLAPLERESVCNQCHVHGEFSVPRYGRTLRDFRPGMRLEEVVLVLISGTGIDASGETMSVSQVEQMQESVCFQKSGGKLGCTSCHDPHAKEKPDEKVEFYRQRCLNCHAEQGCSLPHQQQAAPPALGSCIHCHMPATNAVDVSHASQTDHRVLRDPAAHVETGTRNSFDQWKLLDGAEARVPAWEVRRARGMTLLFAVRSGKAPEQDAAQAAKLLAPLTRLLPDDGPLYFALGETARLQERYDESARYFEEAVRIEPENSMYQRALARIEATRGNWEQARPYIDKAVELNPWQSQDFVLQAEIHAALGNRKEALAAARAAANLDPNQRDLWSRIWRQLNSRRP